MARVMPVERDFMSGFSLVTDGRRWGCRNDDADNDVRWCASEAEARANYAEHVRLNHEAARKEPSP